MANSQPTSNDDRPSSSELLNDTLDNHEDTIKFIHNGKVPKPDDERKLFVGQLSSDITKEDLEKYFGKFGRIEDVTIKYDVPGGRARGFAFILFDEKESIEKVLHVQSHLINQCQIDPKPAHRRPPVSNPVKKIFIGQLPVEFVEQDLSDYFSQFGIIDTIELPMDREKSVRRPFGFVSFSSEKTAEEVLRQQRHSVNGASIEVRPAKPRPHEQQQQQMQQQYQYGEYLLPQHLSTMLIPSSTMTHISPHTNHNSYYTSNHNGNYPGQIDQWSQGANSSASYWNTSNGDSRSNNNSKSNSVAQWSTGNNAGLASGTPNNSVYSTSGNSISSSSYHPNQGQAMYNPQALYPSSNYPPALRSSYSQSTGNIYPSGYPSSSAMIPTNDLQSSSWNPYATASNVANGTHQVNYDPNMYYAPYYPEMFAQQQYYPAVSQSQAQIPTEQSSSPNEIPSSSSNAGAEKNNYPHVSR